MKFDSYRTRYDLDVETGKIAMENGCHYVMMSTRKVYGGHTELESFTEESPLDPYDHYSENKMISEQRLTSFGDNVTILRGSNIFGFEYGRQSFMGYCMTQLKDYGIVTYEYDPELKRDFIDIDTVCKVLKKVAEVKPKGIYNLSSNTGLEIGNVTKYLIKGYGEGKIVVSSQEVEEQFILDNSKLEKALNINIGPFDFDNIIYELGKKL